MATTYQNLFVTKLPRNINDADLMTVFASFSPNSAKVMLDAATGKSKGFGFVLFSTIEQGQAAFDAMNHKHVAIHGHGFTLNIFPSKHDGKTATVESNALYIRNIPISMTKHNVELFLTNFGTMTYCAMREDHYGSPVWVVYVEYDCIECAKNALRSLHGNNTYFHDSPAPILAKFADCDEAKKERRRRRDENHPPATGTPVTNSNTPINTTIFPVPSSSDNPLSIATHNPVPVVATMFKPMAMVSHADIASGQTLPETGVIASGAVDRKEQSVSFSSAYSLSVSGYRHNPYGNTPVRVEVQDPRPSSPVV